MTHPIKTLAGASIFALCATFASAATVTIGGTAFSPATIDTPTSTTGNVLVNVTGDSFTSPGVDNRADPWAATPFAGVGKYLAVEKNSSATYAFADLMTSIDILWGSPDVYNFIEFALDGVIVDSIGGGMTGIANFADQTTDRFVTVTSNRAFNSVTYRSTFEDAFELAFVTPGTVPVPAAGLMLLSGLGGIAALRRRRKA